MTTELQEELRNLVRETLVLQGNLDEMSKGFGKLRKKLGKLKSDTKNLYESLEDRLRKLNESY